MALIEQKRLILKNGKVDWIAYDTNLFYSALVIYREYENV